MRMRFLLASIIASLLALCAAASSARAERVRIGVLATVGSGPFHIALAKGYFKKEGLDAEIIIFDTSQPMMVSIVTGDLDFGATAFSSGFYNLASQGLVKIIGAQGRDVPGFANNGLVVSMPMWEIGRAHV